jgi:uncharacterized FlaG/YvyC family protein
MSLPTNHETFAVPQKTRDQKRAELVARRHKNLSAITAEVRKSLEKDLADLSGSLGSAVGDLIGQVRKDLGEEVHEMIGEVLEKSLGREVESVGHHLDAHRAALDRVPAMIQKALADHEVKALDPETLGSLGMVVGRLVQEHHQGALADFKAEQETRLQEQERRHEERIERLISLIPQLVGQAVANLNLSVAVPPDAIRVEPGVVNLTVPEGAIKTAPTTVYASFTTPPRKSTKEIEYDPVHHRPHRIHETEGDA